MLTADVTLAAMLDMVADRVAARVLASLRAVDEAKPYSTARRPHVLPSGISSARTFATHCREISAARATGRGWVCSRDAWEAHLDTKRARRRRKKLAPVVPIRSLTDDLADRMVAATSRTTKP